MKRMFSVVVALLPAAAWALQSGDATRGKAVHEAKCTACHISKVGGDGSGLYTRADRKVKTVEGLMKQVEMCNQMTKADLNEGQQADLVKYLSEQYYKFR